MAKFLSVHTGHDASISFKDKDGNYRIVEVERVRRKRHTPLFIEKYEFRYLKNYIEKNFGVGNFDTIIGDCDIQPKEKEYYETIWGAKNFIRTSHHDCHAACALYQSPYEKSLIITCDGFSINAEGIPEFFNIYIGDKKTGITLIKRLPIALGLVYDLIAVCMKDIKKRNMNVSNCYDYYNSDSNTVFNFSGKLMALTSFTEAVPEWKDKFKEAFKLPAKKLNAGTRKIGIKKEIIENLGKGISVDLGYDKISGELSYKVAATLQESLEEVFLDAVLPVYKEFNLPVCFSGGVALNVLLNNKLKEKFKKGLYIPPNPNDCGLSIGGLFLQDKPAEAIKTVYSGIPITVNDFVKEDYVSIIKSNKGKPLDINRVVEQLVNGKIVAVMRGNSECGPRALGNRSILCNPSVEGMKDKLNEKVKFRENFRPFAPVVLEEEVGQYFNFKGTSTYMSYAPKIKEEWESKIPEIVHVDKTCRVQTINKEDNAFLYDLLVTFKEQTGFCVLLNTSFNTHGNPIISDIVDAIAAFKTVGIDTLIIEDYMITKEEK